MTTTKLAAAWTTLAFLCACQGSSDPDETGNESAKAPVSAEGKAEEGKISVKAPGFDLAISLPKEMADEARADRDSKIIYPGSAIGGIAIAAGPGGDKGGDSEVEMRFATADPLEKVTGWYRDPARSEGFRLEQVRKEGDSILITGTQKRDDHPLKVRLSPRSGGGTEGRLTIRHAD